MSRDRYDYDLQWSSGNDQPADTRCYLALPFDARMVSDQEALLLAHGETQFRRLPLPVVRVLGLCSRFRTFDQHARGIAAELNAPPGQAPAVKQILQQLVEQKLLLGEAEVLARLTASKETASDPAAIETLFVRTCARPETLGRLLESLAEPATSPGLERCVILDDDPEPAGQQRTGELVEEYRERIDANLHHVARPERRTILTDMANAAGADPDRLAWFVEGDADDDQPGYGAGLNLALLLGAGTRMAIVDDDAVLTAFTLPPNSDTPAFQRKQSARLHFPEPDQPLGEQYEAARIDPVAAHARLLGRSCAAVAELGRDHPGELLADLDPQLLLELSANPSVKITSSGTLGDPGTSGIQWLFTEPAGNLKALCESEARYRSLLGQRQVARSPGQPLVTTSYGLMTTTLTGIDNRDLLLPTQPRGANEDLLFGALTGFLYPGALQVTLPHMLPHLRPQPRRWQSKDLERPRSINRGAYLSGQIERLTDTALAQDIDSRVGLLTEMLDNLARLDQQRLAQHLRHDLLDLRGSTIERISATRAELKPPGWLDADFERVLACHGEVSEATAARLDQISRQLPDFAGQFACGLQDWVQTWRQCRESGMDQWLKRA